MLIPAMLLISRRLKYDARRRFSYRSLMALSLLALAAFVAFLVFQGSLNAGLPISLGARFGANDRTLPWLQAADSISRQ
jgi:hypothetical protein